MARKVKRFSRKNKTTKSKRKGKSKKGGSIVGGVLAALRQALPSYLLYQAVKVQQKRRHKKTHKGGRKSRKGGRKSRKGGRRKTNKQRK